MAAEDGNSEDEDELEGFGNQTKKRSPSWRFYTEININGIKYAQCGLCVDIET